MIFRIFRTSNRYGSDNEAPCEGAVLRYGEWKTREEQYNALDWSHQRHWCDDNHGYATDPDTDTWRNWWLDGDTRRWEERERWWEIEIGDLDALLASVGQVGKVIISEAYKDGYELEVYDDHRE